MLKLKKDVSLSNLTTGCLMGHLVIQDQFEESGKDCIITSGDELDSKHSRGTLHYSGNAIDYRSWIFDNEKYKTNFVTFVRVAFGNNPDYEFYYEPEIKNELGEITRHEHFHYEFQRKGK